MTNPVNTTLTSKHVGGSLRVLLGVVQLMGAGLGVGFLVAYGWTSAAWWSFAVMLAALAASRAIYRGR